MWLRFRLGNSIYRVNFMIAERLAVDVLIGTSFLNKHVVAIECIAQKVRLQGSTIPILNTQAGPQVFRRLEIPDDEDDEEVEVQSKRTPTPRRQNKRLDDRVTDRIRLAKGLTLEPYTQQSVRVHTQASALVFIEPRANVQQRYQVRVANSIAEVTKGKPFDVLISNFGNTVRKFPKAMVVATAAANPLALVSLGGEVGRDIAA